MPSTSGTRHGNGAGHGGPAKGFVRKPPRAFTTDSATRVNPADSNGDPEAQAYRTKQQSRSRARRERLEDLADAALVVMAQIMRDAQHPKRFDAAREALNRTDGVPAQRVDPPDGDGDEDRVVIVGGLPD